MDNQVSLLIDDKHPQPDLFICDVADAVLKDIMPQMEHPFYSLSKKPDRNIRRYEHKGNWLEITPSVKGMATIYDKDVLIYAISQVMAKLNRQEKVSKRVRINCRELLRFANRGTSGKDYNALCEAIDRLAGTRISTNITEGEDQVYRNFGLIDEGSISRKNGLDGRIQWVEITLSDWVFDAVKLSKVLTLNRDYFRLRKPLERRVYEIVRKHCGTKAEWSIGLELLHKKSGSQSNIRLYKAMIKNIVKSNHLPDYTVTFNDETQKVTFASRGSWTASKPEGMPVIQNASTYKKASEILGEGVDVFTIEKEWVAFWYDNGCSVLKSPDYAFLGYCEKYHKNK